MSTPRGALDPVESRPENVGVKAGQEVNGSTAAPSASSNSSRGAKPQASPEASEKSEAGKLTHLVIDSGAIIKGAGMSLASTSENFWTVPEVVAEIRDKNARRNLGMLPFELKLKEPSDEAMKFVMRFAKQTGDLHPLSMVDLKVLALTYMLERQETGGAHLRTTPVKPGTSVRTKNKVISTSTLAVEQSDKLPKHPAAECDANDDAATRVGGVLNGKPRMTESGTECRDGADADMRTLCEQLGQTKTTDLVDDSPGGVPATGAVSRSGAGEIPKGIAGTGISATVEPVKEGKVAEVKGEDVQEDGEVNGNGDDELEHCGVEQDDGDSDDGEEEEEDDGEEEDSDEEEGYDDELRPEVVEDVDGDARQVVAERTSDDQDEPVLEDFPSLGGASVRSPQAGSSIGAALPAVSWSVMARSNPAPFKNSVKHDPPPIVMKSASAVKSVTSPPEPRTSSKPGSRPDGAGVGASRILGASAAFGMSGGKADEDDGEGWINPSNIKLHKMLGMGIHGPPQSQKKLPGVEKSKCCAGCATTDFAMQNVLLQVGLPLLSLDGMTVKRVQQWILRCAACFKTCKEMNRLFCPVCGSATMNRVACSVDARTGAIRLHLRKTKKNNLRGTKYSIPAPNPTKGRFEGDLLLREDQLFSGIWAQKAKRRQKNVASMFGEDITSNVGLTVSKSADIVVGYGRKNPNAARGRERRGKKASKKRP